MATLYCDTCDNVIGSSDCFCSTVECEELDHTCEDCGKSTNDPDYSTDIEWTTYKGLTLDIKCFFRRYNRDQYRARHNRRKVHAA